ncbi:hypothetical protein MON41_18960 [Roseomonas vastitatis]|uniref:Uncharacterized protein n=2 Tax=Teichococcus vastitatis TaxID=2307076 RepID=A0ABS9W9T9_9PROT|nr:hypothetical protein [Pseudoroseomonas vastitatis]
MLLSAAGTQRFVDLDISNNPAVVSLLQPRWFVAVLPRGIGLSSHPAWW